MHNLPTIGYNRFFYQSGAALAFILDYRKIGMQTAHLIHQINNDTLCNNLSPMFEVWQNRRVIEKLKIISNRSDDPLIKFGP